MIIDSHQHFWDISRGDYAWLTSELKVLYRNFLPSDLEPMLARGQVSKTVLVQAAPTLAETEYMLGLAEENHFIAGVVGWVDMLSSDVIHVISTLAENPYFKGIRPMIQDIEDPEWMLDPDLGPAFRELIDNNLCFDALVKPIHLSHLLVLLERYPELNTVIDHGAKPDIAQGNFSDWAAAMSQLAKNTNVYCKLSGLLTEAKSGAGFEDIKPYMQHLLTCFGPERLLWGSDWPVLNLASDYAAWMGIVENFLANLDAQAQSMIMGGNAARFYRL